MNLKLKFVTCPVCSGHSFDSCGSCDETAVVDCRCGNRYKTEYQYKSVDYPNVTILGEKFEKLDVEKEIFFNESNGFPFGVNVALTFHKESYYSGRRKTRYNATEFHYLYETFGFIEYGVAIESNIHRTGGTIDLTHIKSIVITKAIKKHRDH